MTDHADPGRGRRKAPGVLWAIYLTASGTSSSILSPQQRRLAAVSAQAPQTSPRLLARVTGPLDTTALRTAIEAVFNQHAALRQFLLVGNGEARVWTATSVRRTASPGTAAVASLTLRRDGSYQLMIQPGTGSVDATGLLRALHAIVTAFQSGDPTDLPEAQPDPQSVARYFDELLHDKEASAGRRYWQRCDPDQCAAPDLARSLGIRPAGSGNMAAVAVPVDEPALIRLLGTADTAGIPARSLILSAWRLLLSRIAPSEVGSLGVFQPGSAGDLPRTIGLLGRYVPVQVLLPLDGTVAQAVESCGADLAGTGEWADFFSWPGTQSGNCGYSVTYRHADDPGGIIFGGAAATVETVDAPIDRSVVELQSFQASGGLRLALRYETSAWDGRTAERLARWLATILERLPDLLSAAASDAVAAALQLSPRASRLVGESRQLADQTLAVAFEDQARRTPDAVAVRDDDTRLTYRQLAATAAAVSDCLASIGVAAGTPVAVCMQRRVPLLAALLAVMHHGAYFVLLDPEHPPGRLASILRDSAPLAVITDEETNALCPSQDDQAVLLLDSLPDGDAVNCAPAPARGRGSDTAYMIYTSGSTGEPKGVQISHASLLNYLRWASAEYRVAEGCGTLVHSSVAVDMTITSLFVPLLTGQTVTLLPSGDPEALAGALTAACGLSLLKMTPGGVALLTQLLPASRIAEATRHLVVGGEQLTTAALAGLAGGAEGLLVTNEYGPTETTVGSCAYTFPYGADIPDPVPIGRPIWNTTIQLCAAAGMPCLPGTAGEIVIGGAGVGAGYYLRPDETAARFVTAAAAGMADVTYRTGDIGRLRDEGDLVMLGRHDQQAKMHGYRVEPAEVEAVLTRDTRIAAAAVIPVTAEQSDVTFLSAFVVPADGAAGILDTVRGIVEAQLPFFARPDRVEIVERLPLNRSGKVDRRKLAERSSQPSAGPWTISPGDGRLTALREVWRRVLGRPAAAADDNFFAAGADSIKALQLVAEARQAGLLLTIQDVLYHRTLRRIASAARAQPPSPPTDQAFYEGPIPLTPAQAAVLEVALHLPERWTLRWVFDAAGVIDHDRLTTALEAVHRWHPALRCRFARADGAWSARIGPPEPVTPHLTDLSGIPADHHDAVIRRCLADREAQLRLGGQTSCLCMFRCGGGRPDRLGWVVQHLVCDVVSLHILTRDLWAAYDNTSADGVELAGAADRYVDWTGSAVGQQPVQFAVLPRHALVRTAAMSLGRDTGQALNHLAPHRTRWRPAVLLASLMRSLAVVLPDLPAEVCVEEHGRDHGEIDVSGTVGWLTAFRAVDADRGLLHSGRDLAEHLHHQLTTSAGRHTGALPYVALNYLGDFPAGGRLDVAHAAEPGQEAAGPPPLFGLEVVCWTADDRLELLWRHILDWLPASAADRLAETFEEEASALISELTTADPAGVPAPLAATDLSDADLARILNMFGES